MEAYWVPELKHGLVSPQDIHTKERNTMSFQNKSIFEGEERFSGLMVNTKVKGYRGQPDLQTNKIQYNHQNNLPIHSYQLHHAQQWTESVPEAVICETINHNKNLTADYRELLQWHILLGNIGFSHVRFLSRAVRLLVKNPKAVANCDKVKCESLSV